MMSFVVTSTGVTETQQQRCSLVCDMCCGTKQSYTEETRADRGGKFMSVCCVKDQFPQYNKSDWYWILPIIISKAHIHMGAEHSCHSCIWVFQYMITFTDSFFRKTTIFLNQAHICTFRAATIICIFFTYGFGVYHLIYLYFFLLLMKKINQSHWTYTLSIQFLPHSPHTILWKKYTIIIQRFSA